jgi:hypothetical protein
VLRCVLTGASQLRTAAALLALAALSSGCKRRESELPPTKLLAPYLRWCELQGAARSTCLVSAARVTGDAAACARLKRGAPERTACLTAAARTSGRVDACRALADRPLLLCALTVAAVQGRASACEALENVRWQGVATRPVCLSVAGGASQDCLDAALGPELGKLCLRFAALRLKDASLCSRLKDEPAEAQRCAAAVAVARHAPLECAGAFAQSPPLAGGPTQRACEVEADIARGRLPPCFSEAGLCERSLWVARPCEGTSGAWADDCRIHQAVFSTGPFGCGGVQDAKRRALCGELRDVQEGLNLLNRPDAGTAPPR